jgi:predicted RNA binding protein YcfA (HicA-like mRNA interferase family)
VSVSTDFSGRDIVKVLRKHGYEFVGRTGSHVRMRDVTDDGSVRNVTIPMKDRIPEGTLRNIAEQCGANEFREWCRWIDRNR